MSLYSIESQIIENINDLNGMYYECLSGTCDKDDMAKKVAETNVLINKFKSIAPTSDAGNNQVPTYQTIIDKYNRMQAIRGDINNKVDDIQNTGNSSKTKNVLLHAEDALYANIGWALLATTVLYYTFMKLSK